MRRMTRTLVAAAVVALGVVAVAPSAWDEARHMLRESHRVVDDVIVLSTERTIRVADAALTGRGPRGLSTAIRWRFAGRVYACTASMPRRARSVVARKAGLGHAVVRLPVHLPAALARTL